MGHEHHHHHHYDGSSASSKKLGLAVLMNILLTVVQLVAGIISGSLALIADAVHNLSDAGSLIIAFFAHKIAHKPADHNHSYGYRRAEILGALINSTSLVIVGVYLIFKAVTRIGHTEPIDGPLVMIVAGIALVIDLITAYLVYKAGSSDNINIRAALIHNLSDAFASVAVIISGLCIWLFEVYWIDIVATLIISGYIIYHGYFLIKKSIRILMQAVPDHICMGDLKSELLKIESVISSEHIHLWQLDDKKTFFEGHIEVSESSDREGTRIKIKELLKEKFKVAHSTVELVSSEPVKAHKS